MEPLTLIAGALIALASYGLGHLNGRRRRKLSEPSQAVCEGCTHGLSHHDDHGKCHATEVRETWNKHGDYIGKHPSACTCQQYVGPIPADRMLASFSPSALPAYSKGDQV